MCSQSYSFKLFLIRIISASPLSTTQIDMNKDYMVKNLGAIVRYGTKEFIEALQAGEDVSIIG
jgi:hypothetical protein